MESRTVKLPIGNLLVRRTGRQLRVKDIPDHGMFEHDGEVWEKMGQSNACLSNMEDESEVMPHVRVEELEEVVFTMPVPTPSQK